MQATSPALRPSGPRRCPWGVRLTALVAVALLLTSALAYFGSGSLSSASSSGCSYAPITSSWLSQQAQAWSSAPPRPLASSALLSSASYGTLEEPWNSLAAVETELAMLKASGVQVVRIDLNYAPWLDQNATTIAEVGQIVASIRADGLQLMIADSASESYWHHPMPWDAFSAAWVSRVTTIAALYHPDYYEVVKEPGWYYPMLQGFPESPTVQSLPEWTSVTEQLIAAVRSVSPETSIGVAVPASTLYGSTTELSFTYLAAAEKMAGLDFIGFDIYGVCDFEDTLRFLQQEGTGGKQVWVPEAWSTSGSGVEDPSRASLDVQWARVLYEFLAMIDARGVALFYTDAMASYSSPPQTASGLVSFYQGRTPVFYEVQNLTSANRRLTFAITAFVEPSWCSPPELNGTSVPSGGVASLPVGVYSVLAPLCGGEAFVGWSSTGEVSIGSFSSSLSTILVRGPGTVRALYALPDSTAIALEIAPVPCNGSSISIGGQTGDAGSWVPLETGTYSVSATSCAGLTALSWAVGGNVTLSSNGQVLVTGPGWIEAVYSPPAPGPLLLSLPSSQGYAVVLAAALAVLVGLAVVGLDRSGGRRGRASRVRIRERTPASSPVPTRPRVPGLRLAFLGWIAQLLITALWLLLSLVLWDRGYVIGGQSALFYLLAGIEVPLLLFLVLYLAWTRVVRPLRKGEGPLALGPLWWLGAVELFAGLGVAGALYLLSYRVVKKSAKEPAKTPS